jgi:hypothetical protein
LNQVKLYRKLALEYLGDKCVHCGSTERLHIHHKDVNSENNNVSNLELLCIKCHMGNPHPNGFPKNLLSVPMTGEQKEAFRKVNGKRMKLYRDKKRVRKFSPRKKEI